MLSAVRGKAKLHQKIGNVFLVRFGSRIFLRDDLVKLRFGVLAPWAKPVVPDIKWLQRAAQPRLNQLRSLRDQR